MLKAAVVELEQQFYHDIKIGNIVKNMSLGLRHDWHNRKCKRVFMVHNFKNIQSWDDKARNT